MDTQRFAQVFPLGTHLCREPMPPMTELKRDMQIMQQQGFNLIKLQEQWMSDEPVEGQLDLSKYEELIEYAGHLDMGVYLGLTCEQAPSWLWRKHPGCRTVGRNGLPVVYEAQIPLPADGKPGPCFDDPGAMADQLRFIRQLVNLLSKYENIVLWNTWQEVGYWSESLVGQSTCYCENSLAAFRSWLQGKYGDLDTLNRKWNMRYRDWNDVQPNRHGGRSCCPQDIEWGYFQDNVRVSNTLRARAETIRDADPWHRPVFAHKGSVNIGSGQDWIYARCQDFLGSSAYPAWGALAHWDDGAVGSDGTHDRHTALLAEMWNGVALKYDYVRSCNPAGSPVYAAEFQGGPVSTSFHKGRVPDAADMRRWMLTAIGSGVSAISFWVTRAEIAADELNGFSLLDSEGDDTERLTEAARIGCALNQHADLFGTATTPRSDVAIVVDETNYQVCNLLGKASEHLPYSVRGWHRLLWDCGISVDFIEAGQLAQGTAAAYKALVLAFPLSMAEATAEQLSAYVAQGGHLISDACPGRVSPMGFASRGELSPAMRKLFGVRQTSLTMVREPAGGSRWSPVERTWGEYIDASMLNGIGVMSGESLRANVYVETFSNTESDVFLAHNGVPVGVVKHTGKGSAWLLGTFAGHNGTAYRDEQSARFVKLLMAQCGVSPAHDGQLLLRKRVLPHKQAWVFTNPTPADVSEWVNTAGWDVEDLLGEALVRRADDVLIDVPSLDVRVLLLNR